MSAYQRILVAIDLSEEAQPVLDRAFALSNAFSCDLHLIHAIEPLSFSYGGDLPMDFTTIQGDIEKQLKKQLFEFASKNSIPEDHIHLCIGRTNAEVHDMATKIGVDLIVVGSHGRHGLSLLMGSTSNAVLHGATCDVLAVRVGL